MIDKTVVTRLSDYYSEAVGISPKDQRGLYPHRSTIEVMIGVRRLQELAWANHISLRMCFVDQQKAYNSVDREKCWLENRRATRDDLCPPVPRRQLSSSINGRR